MTFTPSVLSKVDANNTTDNPLGAGASFTGVGTRTTGYDTIVVTVETSVQSAPTGLEIQFSDDNILFTTLFSDTVYPSGIGYTRTYLVVKEYYRVQYTTGAAVNPFKLTTRITPQLSSTTAPQVNNIALFDNAVETTLDAFGKLRVSNPVSLVDLRFPALPSAPVDIRENTLQLDNYTSLTGWSATAPGDGTKVLASTGASAGLAVSQSRTFINYQPGKSLLMLFSGVFKSSDAAYSSQVGLFESSVFTGPPYVASGVYLSFVAGTPYVNVAASTGSITSIAQDDWNVDNMKGSGPSGLTLDFLKCQLLVIDLEWLGVGRIRFGFYAFGRIQYCHQITNINALTGPYTPTINLPVTHMLYSTTAPGVAGSIKQICSTVVSEGGYSPIGRPFSVNTGSNADTQQISVKSDQQYPLIAIRGAVGNGFRHQTILPTAFTLIDTDTNNTLLYRLWLYTSPYPPNAPVVTNWYLADANNSVVEYAPGVYATGSPPVITSNFALPLNTSKAVLINSGYALGKGTNIISDLSTAFTTLLSALRSDIVNTPDILLLTAQRVAAAASGTTAKVWASMDWQEVY